MVDFFIKRKKHIEKSTKKKRGENIKKFHINIEQPNFLPHILNLQNALVNEELGFLLE